MSHDATDAAPCRRLWSAVVIHALNDWWHQARSARQRENADEEIERVRLDALHYFRSRNGREVLALAGITADPERMAAIAVDPDARNRILTWGDLP